MGRLTQWLAILYLVCVRLCVHCGETKSVTCFPGTVSSPDVQGSFALEISTESAALLDIPGTTSWPGAPRDLQAKVIGRNFTLDWMLPDDVSAQYLVGFNLQLFLECSSPVPVTYTISTSTFTNLTAAHGVVLQDIVFHVPCVYTGPVCTIAVFLESRPWPPDPRPVQMQETKFQIPHIAEVQLPPSTSLDQGHTIPSSRTVQLRLTSHAVDEISPVSEATKLPTTKRGRTILIGTLLAAVAAIAVVITIFFLRRIKAARGHHHMDSRVSTNTTLNNSDMEIRVETDLTMENTSSSNRKDLYAKPSMNDQVDGDTCNVGSRTQASSRKGDYSAILPDGVSARPECPHRNQHLFSFPKSEFCTGTEQVHALPDDIRDELMNLNFGD